MNLINLSLFVGEITLLKTFYGVIYYGVNFLYKAGLAILIGYIIWEGIRLYIGTQNGQADAVADFKKAIVRALLAGSLIFGAKIIADTSKTFIKDVTKQENQKDYNNSETDINTLFGK